MTDQLEELRRLPGVWISIICTSRDGDDLAWSLTAKYGANVVQHVHVDLDVVVAKLAETLRRDGLLAPDETPPRKLKLKRSTP